MTFDEWWNKTGAAESFLMEPAYVARLAWDFSAKVERNECAKACEQRIGTGSMYASSRDFFNTKKIINECEFAIRARGNK